MICIDCKHYQPLKHLVVPMGTCTIFPVHQTVGDTHYCGQFAKRAEAPKIERPAERS